jgi:hypothetical protein
MNEQLQNAIQAYGQAQFNLGVAMLRLEQSLAPKPEPQPEPKEVRDEQRD